MPNDKHGLVVSEPAKLPVGAETKTKTARASNEAAVLEEMGKTWANYRQGRWLYEHESFRNILYYLGYQWLQFDLQHRQWRRQELKSWVPRPVTNRFAPTLDIIRSAIINSKPNFLIDPARLSDQIITAARVANDFLKVLQADSMFRKAKRDMASWLTLTGTCLFGTEFSLSEDYGVVTVFGERCVLCGLQVLPKDAPDDGVCPDCGSNQWLEDKSIHEDVPRGRLVTTAWSPFETYVDQGTQSRR